jgi:poly(beta-D-mannuronate) lyase
MKSFSTRSEVMRGEACLGLIDCSEKAQNRRRRRLSENLVAMAALFGSYSQLADAAEYLVASASQIASRLATAQPGDTLVMADGTWTNQRIQFAALGTAAAPITLRAQTPGGVVLNGNSKINISGSHLIVDGLRFEGGALAEGDHVVEFRGSRGEATFSRLTNSAIIDYNPTSVDTRYFWVSLYGQNNRVDHNRFEGQNHSGVTVVVWRDAGADYHLIDSNHFVDRPPPMNPADSNGFETIRIGDSSQSLSNSFTTVEGNLFERVDGEIEIISNKSGSNVFRYNTFRESAGTLTLRHGNDNRVEGNFFLGNNKSQSGGVRVIGERQTIVNNYFANVDDRAGGAISISAGVPNSALNEYFQVKDAVIAHNSLVNILGRAMTFDEGLNDDGRTLLAQNVTVSNNIFRNSNQSIFEGNEGTGWTWEGNIAFGGSLGPVAANSGIAVVDPQLAIGADGLWRPAASSPVVNGGVGSYSGLLTTDMDGQPRVGVYDIGADEASVASILHRPLTAMDVGPAWLGGPASFAAADFNRNGIVDSGDLAMWGAGYGTANGATRGAGDANGDGIVDGSDFLAWQSQVGPGAMAGVAVTPELGGWGLSVMGLAVMVFHGEASSRFRLTSRQRGRQEHDSFFSTVTYE